MLVKSRQLIIHNRPTTWNITINFLYKRK